MIFVFLFRLRMMILRRHMVVPLLSTDITLQVLPGKSSHSVVLIALGLGASQLNAAKCRNPVL